MRGRRPKPTRLKMLTGNPGKRPLNDDEPRPEDEHSGVPAGAWPGRPSRMGPARRRTRRAAPAHQSRSRGACRLLRRLRALGRGDRADPEIRRHDQVAAGLPDPVALPLDRQPAGRDHDADRIRVRIHAREPKPHICPRTGWTRPIQRLWQQIRGILRVWLKLAYSDHDAELIDLLAEFNKQQMGQSGDTAAATKRSTTTLKG